MPTKAKLTIKLYADDKLIAEIENAALWNRILSYDVDEPITLTQQGDTAGYMQVSENASADESELVGVVSIEKSLSAKIASDAGVSEDQVEGALSPECEDPFITIEHKNWSLYKKSLPAKGPKAYPDVVIAATLILICLRSTGTKEVSKKTVSRVVNEMGGNIKNAHRSYVNCEWIKVDSEKLKLNPSKFNEALDVFVAFVQAN